MLAVTEAAADAISALTSQRGIDQDGGLRFAVQTRDDSQDALALTVAPGPADGDEVVTVDAGAHVFLEPRAAQYLSDKLLDVEQDQEGQVNFTIMEQPA
jgi:iron-sulfur cluster assembly protein